MNKGICRAEWDFSHIIVWLPFCGFLLHTGEFITGESLIMTGSFTIAL